MSASARSLTLKGFPIRAAISPAVYNGAVLFPASKAWTEMTAYS